MDPKGHCRIPDGAICAQRRAQGRGRAGTQQIPCPEIQVGPFQRLIGISGADRARQSFPTLRHGLLEIRLKKKGDTPTRRRIDVK